jgi:hypothetical protein
MITRLLMIAALVFTLTATAFGRDVYRYIDDDGNVVFSDKPVPGSEPVKSLPARKARPGNNSKKANQSSPQPAGDKTSARAQQQAEADKFPGYDAFKITNPKDDEAFWSAPGIVELQVMTKPELQIKRGHVYALIMDGQHFEGLRWTSSPLKLENVARGTHTFQALIINNDDNSILTRSNTVTLHLKRPSRLFK